MKIVKNILLKLLIVLIIDLVAAVIGVAVRWLLGLISVPTFVCALISSIVASVVFLAYSVSCVGKMKLSPKTKPALFALGECCVYGIFLLPNLIYNIALAVRIDRIIAEALAEGGDIYHYLEASRYSNTVIDSIFGFVYNPSSLLARLQCTPTVSYILNIAVYGVIVLIAASIRVKRISKENQVEEA